MIWPVGKQPPGVEIPQGYRLRQGRQSDVESFRQLMERVQLGNWQGDELARVRAMVLDRGWFVVVDSKSKIVVATAMAQDRPTELHPDGGEVGWVASHPSHRGKALGKCVVTAALGRLVEAGYQRIYLSTDDHRMPAIGTYLKLGFEPLMFQKDMPGRWAAVMKKLGTTSNR